MGGLIVIALLIAVVWLCGFWNVLLSIVAIFGVMWIYLYCQGLLHRRLCQKDGRVVGSIWYHMHLVQQEEKVKKGELSCTDEKLKEAIGASIVKSEIAYLRSVHGESRKNSSNDLASKVNSEITALQSIKNSNKSIPNGCGKFRFSYVDANEDYSSRTVTVYSYQDGYFEGHCHSRNAIRTFRTKRVLGDITDVTTGEVLTPRKWMTRMRKSAANSGYIEGRDYRP